MLQLVELGDEVKRILLIQRDGEKRELLGFALSERFHLKCADVDVGEAALAYMQKEKAESEARKILEKVQDSKANKVLSESKVDLVICEFCEETEPVIDFICKEFEEIPIILTSKNVVDADFISKLNLIGVARANNLQDNINILIESWLARLESQNEEGGTTAGKKVVDDGADLDSLYCPVKISLLKRVGSLKSDVYIRLSKQKYIKLFKDKDNFDAADFQRYHDEKNVEFLYIRNGETTEFLNKFQSDLRSLIAKERQDPKSFDYSKAREILSSSHDVVRELIEKVGFNDEIQDIAKESVNLAVRAAKQNPKLGTLLSTFNKNSEEYISGHSLLLGEVACCIAQGMEWQSKDTFFKLTMAAYFHDITLKNQELAAIQSMQEFQRKEDVFTHEEAKDFLTHPLKSSDIVKQFHEIPPDVDSIILQHHERPDAEGFPRKLTHKYINPLSCLFIIAHHVVSEMLGCIGQFDMQKFIQENKDYYEVGNFRKIFKTLVNLNQK